MTKQLKPCPFCGGEAVVKINRGFNRTIFDVFVYCEKCGASTCTYVLKETAIKAWNQRADEDTGLTPHKVEQLKENQRWIPVEERLPKEDDLVLVAVNGIYNHITFRDAIELGEFCSDGTWFIDGYPDWDNPNIVAWMPLPEPYQEDGER